MKVRMGGASEAAAALGISRAQFDRARAQGTYLLEHTQGGTLMRPLTVEEAADRTFLTRAHLIAPGYFGTSLPGRPWVYQVDRLLRSVEEGPPGLEWARPALSQDGAE